MNKTSKSPLDISLPPGAVRVESSLQRPAAVAAAIGFCVIASFEAALALGAPLGRAAWGGGYDQLPPELRIASVVSFGIWVFAALIVLGRAGFRLSPLPMASVRWGIWILIGLSALGALMNFASSSNWERFIWGPFALIMSVLCILVARGGVTRKRVPSTATQPSEESNTPDL